MPDVSEVFQAWVELRVAVDVFEDKLVEKLQHIIELVEEDYSNQLHHTTKVRDELNALVKAIQEDGV